MEIKELSVLITGGAGFIGSHIAEFLLNNGVKYVRIIDNLSTGSYDNIKNLLLQHKNIEFVWGDITNLETCRKACRNISVICHQAALGSVPRSIDDPLTSHNSNVNGFLNILQASTELNIKRIVFATSSSVYGNNTDAVKKENSIGRQLSPYAITKYIDELYAKVFTDLYGLECIGLRYFNVFGPRQNPNGQYAALIPKFIKLLINNDIPTINGDGSNSRDFTFIDNVVYANYLAITTKNHEAYGEIFNVGTQGTVTINQVFHSIRSILGLEKCDPIYGPHRKGDIAHSNACIDKIKNMLGYNPKVSFHDGLEKTIDYFKN